MPLFAISETTPSQRSSLKTSNHVVSEEVLNKYREKMRREIDAGLLLKIDFSTRRSLGFTNEDAFNALSFLVRASVHASLMPPKGGEKKARGENTSAGKRCVDVRDVSADVSARDGKKARVEVVGKRTIEKKKLFSCEQLLLQRTRALGKQMSALSSRLDAFEKVFVDTITTRFEETNGFIFEVLTALSAAPRCAHPFLSS